MLKRQVRELMDHLDDLENRGRRKNIRIVGLPENAEGDHAVKFFEFWLPNSLGIQTKLGRMKIERAHRIPGGPVKTVSPYPRAVLVRFHNYVDGSSYGSLSQRERFPGFLCCRSM